MHVERECHCTLCVWHAIMLIRSSNHLTSCCNKLCCCSRTVTECSTDNYYKVGPYEAKWIWSGKWRGRSGGMPPRKILGLLRLLMVQLFRGKLAKFEWIAYCQKNDAYCCLQIHWQWLSDPMMLRTITKLKAGLTLCAP